jgi:hypothetical protein
MDTFQACGNSLEQLEHWKLQLYLLYRWIPSKPSGNSLEQLEHWKLQTRKPCSSAAMDVGCGLPGLPDLPAVSAFWCGALLRLLIARSLLFFSVARCCFPNFRTSLLSALLLRRCYDAATTLLRRCYDTLLRHAARYAHARFTLCTLCTFASFRTLARPPTRLTPSTLLHLPPRDRASLDSLRIA